MLGLERSSKRLDSSMRAAGLQTGRLGNQFAGLASQIAGVHPVVGNLAGVLGNFAIGGAVTVGVLGGLALIAVAWDKLTESTRKAKEETEKALESIDKAASLKMLGPGGATVEEANKARKEAARLQVQIAALEKEAAGPDSGFGRKVMLEEKLNKLYAERQIVLNRLAEAESMVNERVNEALKSKAAEAAAKAKREAEALAAAMKKAAEFAEKYAAFMYEAGKWTANISGRTLAGLTLGDAQSRLAFDHTPGEVGMSGVKMPFEGLDKRQKDQLRQLGILTDKADENAEMIRSAVLSSAQIIGSAVMSALNVGGGGKGSQIGGMIGAGIGGVLGSALGPPGAVITSGVGSVLGSVIGGLAGSLFGGLFDSNKKEVNANTQALRQLTHAMLLYAPGGFKSEPYRYNASDPRPLDNLGRNVRWNASRGGANPLLGT